MNHQLTIKTKNQPVVLEKLLQVTRYRGFQVTQLSVLPDTEHKNFEIQVSVYASRPIRLLTTQLEKIHDVQQLSLVLPTEMAASA
ncbi:acetolactate synthase 2 small subunit [Algicola sagamiensis]|uniref:acetolactate synthase 2 small subunit n=1 Tax=Algicola sagamiensis TaxID=163869 RepID=UPI00036ABDE5|nr:acetolactate synthase 2 small subunit [Algicola sagamiensis]